MSWIGLLMIGSRWLRAETRGTVHEVALYYFCRKDRTWDDQAAVLACYKVQPRDVRLTRGSPADFWMLILQYSEQVAGQVVEMGPKPPDSEARKYRAKHTNC
jgi:hypothetical protein